MSGTTGLNELWTTGQAADYLKDLGYNRRMVARMVDAGEIPGIPRRSGVGWRRVPASAIRAYRTWLLEQLSGGVQDPATSDPAQQA